MMNVPMPALEFKRQLFHVLFGLVLVVLLWYGILTAHILLGLAVIGIILSFFAKHKHIPGIHWFLQHCERAEDMKTFPGRGVIHYVLGCLLVLVFFEKNTAFASMMILALGDSVSHLVGRYYGKIKHPLNDKKLVEGWLAGILAGFAGALFFVDAGKAFFAAFIAMTAETIEWRVDRRVLDDNLFIPVIAAVVMAFIQLL